MATKEKFADPFFVTADQEKLGWLKDRRSGWQVGEMGLIDAILEKIDPKDDLTFAEVGAGSGEASLPLTCQRLIDRGWSGDLYEMDPTSCARLRANFADNPKVKVNEGEVRCLQYAPHRRIYLIDVDGYDWYLLMSLLMNKVAKPDIIVVEHLDMLSPHGRNNVILNPLRCGTKNAVFSPYCAQASSSAIEFLVQPTYFMICATRWNSLLLRADLLGKFGLSIDKDF
jgi:hypothetical protein